MIIMIDPLPASIPNVQMSPMPVCGWYADRDEEIRRHEAPKYMMFQQRSWRQKRGLCGRDDGRPEGGPGFLSRGRGKAGFLKIQ
ncbi:MAG: hypothetical protein ACLUD2_19585 [Clostridium sp.]